MGHFDLNAALVLVRVVQEGSFRSAARALGMPKTTVSRKVAELEEQLGVQLLHRTTRTLALTDAGAAFVEEAEGAIARLDAEGWHETAWYFLNWCATAGIEEATLIELLRRTFGPYLDAHGTTLATLAREAEPGRASDSSN